MNPAFVAPGLPIATSAFTGRTTLAVTHRQHAVLPRHRAARMLGGAPAPSEDTPVDDASAEDASVAVASAVDIDLPTPATEADEDFVVCTPPQPFLNAQAIAEARERFRLHETDSGSPEYQIATLTKRITYLTNHLKQNPKDFSSTRGLLKMVATRRRLLKYVKRQDPARFDAIVKGLEIRISATIRAL